MIACGLRRWTSVMKATISIGSDIPNTAALRQTTTMLWVTAHDRDAHHEHDQADHARGDLADPLDHRSPTTGRRRSRPTPWTETITETNVAGRSKASSRA